MKQSGELTILGAINNISAETSHGEVVEIVKKIADVESETERSLLIDKLSNKTNIPKRAIQKDVKKLHPVNDPESEPMTTLSASFPGLVDLVVDDGGNVAYLVKNEQSLEVATVWDIDGVLYSPPGKEQLPFVLPSANEVISWYKADNDKKLFEDVLSYLKRFSYLPDNQWLLVACKVFLTYLQDHPDIHYLPMIYFYAVPERGKSRTGKSIVYVSYRGIHTIELREANLFRFSQNLKATIFFDLMDLWKKAEKNGAEDILLLRYEKGAQVSRVIYPEKGAFKDTVYYDIYGPTLIATNEPVHKILESRCISITMPNRPGNYENPTPEKAQELKGRLTAWRAREMNRPLPEINTIEGLGGRLWDISKSLLQICKLVYPQGFDELKGALLEVAGTRIEDKKQSIEGKIIAILHTLSPKEDSEWVIKTSDIIAELNRNKSDTQKLTPQYVGKKLKAMGIRTRHVHGMSECVLKISEFNTLLSQYGIENISPDICKNMLPNATTCYLPTESRDSTGRESAESEEHSTNIRPAETLENSSQVGLVESGRELGKSGKEIFKSSIESLSHAEVLI